MKIILLYKLYKLYLVDLCISLIYLTQGISLGSHYNNILFHQRVWNKLVLELKGHFKEITQLKYD